MRGAVMRSPLSAAVLLGLAVALGWPLVPVTQALPTPPDQGAPTGRQRGGASRGDCMAYQDLTALVPVVDGRVWSQTSSPTPDFFFYVPQPLTTDTALELVVQDKDDNYIFRKQVSVDAPSGILTLPVNPEGAGLNAGETYSWTFSIYCDAARPSASVSVFGTVTRVADTVVTESGQTLTPQQQFNLSRQYVAAGIWHEALALTLALHRADPDNADYFAALDALLRQAGLADLSPAVLVSGGLE
ncbi:DUF928 domain-containing protein [Leptolyngbya sp. KIOST-1]|uniref:DUF928 domain-containing protein n=1 Tax=Leptolyngbya sp. KIOST-1 TaxID=1229172 RepID=UPI0009DD6531|nr:DUF928 domain-containing protein [Leptolyngbya sp. KIOST-1]